MMDKIRICTVPNKKLIVGMPVTFQGNKIGRVIGEHEVAICDDIVSTWIKRQEASFSLEVVYKND